MVLLPKNGTILAAKHCESLKTSITSITVDRYLTIIYDTYVVSVL
jgi:hypothetical protein